MRVALFVAGLAITVLPAESPGSPMSDRAGSFVLDATTTVDASWQREVAAVDARLRTKYAMAIDDTAVGVLDLQRLRLALVRGDASFYAASIPKIAILLAWFQLEPDAVGKLDAARRHELGLMIKHSDNELATKYSRQFGLKRIQEVVDSYGLYDLRHGGGIWLGKHYGQASERLLDPVGNHSHAATVRQLLRFYLLLEQGRLVSPAASTAMREIFASPNLAHRDDKFVRGLAGRDRQILRKAGWWENWFHDSAIVRGPDRHYLVAALTHHAKGDEYLVEFAAAVDDLIGK